MNTKNSGLIATNVDMKKTIIGYSDYLVTSQGEIISVKHGKTIVMKPDLSINGYLQIGLRKPKHKRKKMFVHRLVAEAFIPLIDGKNFVNHKNGIKTDNRAENLEWVTRSENMIHAYSIGLCSQSNRISEKSASKLQREDIDKIKSMKNSGLKQREIAPVFGISLSMVGMICRGEAWK